MLRMAFRITEEAPEPPVPQAPPVADEAPPVADEAPVPEAPPVADEAPLVPDEAPEAAPRFTRDAPKHPVGKVPYLGGRWSLRIKQRCNFCATKSGWRGKLMCETDGCGKSVCPHHSVLLCQVCYQGYLGNR